MKHRSGFFSKKMRLAVAAAAYMLCASCALPSFRPAWSEYEVRRNEVLVAGKIVFDPPLTAEGRDLRAASQDAVTWDGVWLICGDRMRKIDAKKLSPDAPEFRKKISAVQGDTFYYACDARPFYLIAGSFYRNIHRLSTSRGISGEFDAVVLPGSFYVDVKSGDEAVYIGTIKYSLDSAYNAKKIEVMDEYDREMPVFRKIFGGLKLRKALVKPPKVEAVLSPDSMI